ncbi:unnamed protein product [Rangifer tarandus platyrhynchus]|uniref:Uncharacterized protein n=2 Tax=Rangifer tarandus platyrhynchus TaxID=3082113 RepID=A0ABN8ZFI3_RANTA|nr:unnamed protein product [Rangifer tarandus platyrhynchus]CAI9705907.1 unnamed protein product [Rangifer tarandus platyrhynchus]
MPGAKAEDTALEVALRDNSGLPGTPGLFLGRPGTPEQDKGKVSSELETGSRSADRGGLRGAELAARVAFSGHQEVGGGRSLERNTQKNPPRGALTTVTPPARGRQGGRRGAARTAPRKAGSRFRRAGAGRGAPGSRGACRRFRLVRGAAAAE